ncbi:hypothetical protein [Mycobacterium sp. 94-17]|uniref:hypothetical protein n=1 Tax=Mycobacterium sp. 94-17 TaxID=2986147 RepID=UPI002D1F6BF3|nr:hypothetical protein [Mycobacterium sp. 94-17]MEB4208305.1 hypothetical protein [Mycobacterium sp. 94-17]
MTLALSLGLGVGVGLAPKSTGDGSTVDFGNGVVLKLAPGWSIHDQGHGYANLVKYGQGAQLDASSGAAGAPDIGQEATRMIGQDIKARRLIDVQQQPQPQAQTVQGNHFQQQLSINYTAQVQLQQGTAPAYGTWIALFNPSTHTGAFMDYCGISGDAFQASLPDARSMLASMT